MHTKRVWSVDEFCAAHEISRASFYKLRAQGEAPATFKLGRKTLITDSAASDWLRAVSGEGSKPAARGGRR